MQKMVIAMCLFSGAIGGFVSTRLNLAPAALASRGESDEPLRRFDSIQAKHIVLVDEKYRTVMTLDSNDGSPSLTIQSPESGDKVVIQPTGITARSEAARGCGVPNEAAFVARGIRPSTNTQRGSIAAADETHGVVIDRSLFRSLQRQNRAAATLPEGR